MSCDSAQHTIVVTAGSGHDLSVERDIFEGLNVELRAVDIKDESDLKRKLRDADAVIDRLLAATYTADVIETVEQLQVIGRGGIGIDIIDVEAATEHDTQVLNVPEDCQQEVSNHAVMLLLALQRDLVEYNETLKDGVWNKRIGDVGIHRLSEQTFGLVGFGTIARHVVPKVQALGMDVVAADPYVSAEEMARLDVEKRPLEDLLAMADVISVHTPLFDETERMSNTATFEQMQQSAYFINVSRGELVVGDALVNAIERGEIAGAGLDAHHGEPADRFDESNPRFDSPLQEYDDVIMTPNIAWYSKEAAEEKHRTIASDIRRVLENEESVNPVNDVN